MATDLTILMDDQPGELARITGLLGDAGVNIGGFCAVTSGGGRAEVHMLIDDVAAAFSTLATAGVVIVSEQEVLVVGVQDRPGVLGEVSRRLGQSGSTSPWPTLPRRRGSFSPLTTSLRPRLRWSRDGG